MRTARLIRDLGIVDPLRELTFLIFVVVLFLSMLATPVLAFGTENLSYSCALGDIVGVLDILEQGVDPNLPDSKGRLPLFVLIQAGKDGSPACHLDIARILIEHGADVNLATPSNNETVLGLSISRGTKFCAMTELLLEAGADVNQRSGGSLPLELAVQYGSVQEISLLLDRGADVHVRDKSGRSLLQLLLSKDIVFPREIQLLVDAGLDPNESFEIDGDSDVSAMMLIAQFADEELIRSCIEKGAELGHRSKSGKTARDYALEAGNFAVASLLY